MRQKPASADAWALLAAAYSQLGQRQDALRSYQTVLKLQPRSPEALYNVGIIHLQDGRFRDAARYLQAFRQQRPKDTGVLLPLAHCLFQLGQVPQGLEAVDKVLRSAGNSAEIHWKAGQLLLANGLPQEAVRPLETGLKLQPSSDEILLALVSAESRLDHASRVLELLGNEALLAKPPLAIIWSSSLCQLKRCSEAVPILEGLLRQNPNEKGLYMGLAAAYSASSRSELAMQLLRSANARWPDDSEIRTKLAKLLLVRGDAAGASHMLVSKGEQPLTLEQQSLLVQCYLALNRVEDAQKVAEQAVAGGGDPPEGLLVALANIYQLQARDQDVITLLERHRARFGESSSYLFTMSLSYYNRGNYLVARELLAQAIARNPQLAQAHYLTGSCWASMGKPAEAVGSYENAVRLVPDHPLYRFHLGLVLSMVGRKDLAERQLRKSVELNGSHAPARYELAKLYFDSSRDGFAREQLEEGIRADPQFESSYYLLSQVYARLGRREDAARMMKQFQAIKRQRHEEERGLKRLGASAQKP